MSEQRSKLHFIDNQLSSDEEPDGSGDLMAPPRNILAFEDAVLEPTDECDAEFSYRNTDDEDTQSRSSSTDLNHFLQIKQTLGQAKHLDEENVSMQCSIADEDVGEKKCVEVDLS